MKRILLSIASVTVLLSTGFGQWQKQAFDPANARPGEDVEYCVTHKLQQQLMADPNFANQFIADQLEMNAGNHDGAKATTLYIPIVFHLLHNNGSEFITDEQILDALEIINRDYDLMNADAANVKWEFNASNPSATSIPSDVDIQFRLATLAPDGTCFSGITHTVSSATSSGNGTTQVTAIKNGNDVYNGEWPGNKYLNIFICADIGGAAGYTMYPNNSWPGTLMNNGIFVLHSYVGSIGTSSSSTSRTLTHESGHWLNLPHLWGDSNDPGLSTNCNDDDGVADTPLCKGLTSCNLNSNTCTGDNSYWGFDMIDNTENYMEYSYCSKMFTPGQVTRMRNALQSSVGGRSNLTTTTNLNVTGATGVFTLCRAEFSADKTSICAGETVTFSDETYNAVNGWSWTFTGGSPSASTIQNPTVTYSTPGLYTVELTANDGAVNDTETKTAYIRVLPAAASVPFLEDFESYTTFSNLLEWEVVDYSNNAKFELTNTAGHTGTKSAKLPNYGQAAGNADELISAPVDLSGITSATSMTLSFRYSYRLKASTNVEYLKVFATADCGDSWVQRKTIFGTSLSDQVLTSAWTPSSQADWTTVHMTNITSSYWVDNFRYKFRFESDGGNNLYLDNINIYPGASSDALVVGVEDLDVLSNISLYPNPADGELNVRFDIANAENMFFTIQDISGKAINQQLIQAAAGNNLVMMDTKELASGMYFLRIGGQGINRVFQFVVK